MVKNNLPKQSKGEMLLATASHTVKKENERKSALTAAGVKDIAAYDKAYAPLKDFDKDVTSLYAEINGLLGFDNISDSQLNHAKTNAQELKNRIGQINSFFDTYGNLYDENTVKAMRSDLSNIDSSLTAWLDEASAEDYLEKIKTPRTVSTSAVATAIKDKESEKARAERGGRDTTQITAELNAMYDNGGAYGQAAKRRNEYNANKAMLEQKKAELLDLMRIDTSGITHVSVADTLNKTPADPEKQKRVQVLQNEIANLETKISDYEKAYLASDDAWLEAFGLDKDLSAYENVTYGKNEDPIAYIAKTTVEPFEASSFNNALSADERLVYNYLLKNKGVKAAQKWLNSGAVRDTINQRIGQAEGAFINERFNSNLPKTVLASAYGIAGGIGNYVNGLIAPVDATINPQALSTPASIYANQEASKDLGFVGKALSDVSVSIGNMAPSIVIGAINPIAGQASFGVSAAGNAYNEARKEGKTVEQAALYGIVSGASEVFLQNILGGIPGISGASNKLVNAAKNLKTPALRALAVYGIDMVGEATEEYLQEILDPMFRNAIFNEDNEVKIFTGEAAYSAMLGALTSAILNIPTLSTKSTKQLGASMIQGGWYDTLLDNALKLDKDSNAFDLANKLKNGELTASEENIGELLRAYKTDGGDDAFLYEKGTIEEMPNSTVTESVDNLKAETNPSELKGEALVLNLLADGEVSNSKAKKILEDPEAMKTIGADVEGLDTISKKRAVIKEAMQNYIAQNAEKIASNAQKETTTQTATDTATEVQSKDADTFQYKHFVEKQKLGTRLLSELEGRTSKTGEKLADKLTAMATSITGDEDANRAVYKLFANPRYAAAASIEDGAGFLEIIRNFKTDAGRNFARQQMSEFINNAATAATMTELLRKDVNVTLENAAGMKPAEGKSAPKGYYDESDHRVAIADNLLTYETLVGTIAHEGFHANGAIDRELVNNFAKTLEGLWGKDENGNSVWEATVKRKKAAIEAYTGKPTTTLKAEEEVCAEALTMLFNTQKAWAVMGEMFGKIEGSDRLLNRIKNSLDRFFANFKKRFKGEMPTGKLTTFRENLEHLIKETKGDVKTAKESKKEAKKKEKAAETDAELDAELEAELAEETEQTAKPTETKKAPVEDEAVELVSDLYDAEAKGGRMYSASETDVMLPGSKERVEAVQKEITAEYEKTVDDILANTYKGDPAVLLGYTPELFRKLGMPSLPFTIGVGHVYSIATTEADAKKAGRYNSKMHYHGMGDARVKKLYEALANPLMIIAAKDAPASEDPTKTTRSAHSVVAIVDVGTAGKHLVLPVEITVERVLNDAKIDVNVLSSAYDRSVKALVDEAIAQTNTGNNNIYYAKKEATNLSSAGVSFPIHLTETLAASGTIIRPFPEKVNMLVDVVTKSLQFIRWFGDWQNHPKKASKIVNADGTPKVMYHGSPYQFYAFDKKKVKSSGLYGKGFYFTDSDTHAKQYGNLYAVYLDIKNPLSEGSATVTEKQIRKFLEAVAENEDYSIENYGTYDVNEILKGITSRDAFAVITDINATAIGDMVEATELFNKVNGTNFDGIVVPTETVVFKPTQIKAVNNVGTYDKRNDNMYYSAEETDVEETPFESVNEYRAELARIYREGYAEGKSAEEIEREADEFTRVHNARLAAQFGTIKQGEKPAREVEVTKRTSKEEKVSQTVRTILEAGATPDEALPTIERMIANGTFSYKPLSNKKLVTEAEQKIGTTQESFESALKAWLEKENKVSARDIVLGWKLYDYAAKNNQISTGMEILTHIQANARIGAQTTQAARVLKMLSPEGQLYTAKKAADRLTDKLEEEGKVARKRFADKDKEAVEKIRKFAKRKGEEKVGNQLDKIPNGEQTEEWAGEVRSLLAESISRRIKPLNQVSMSRARGIASDLMQFAENTLPKRKGEKSTPKTAAERIRDFFANREEYLKAWNEAKDVLKEKYKSDAESLEMLDDFFNAIVDFNGDRADTVMMRAVAEAALNKDMNIREMMQKVELGDIKSVIDKIYEKLQTVVNAKGADATLLRLAVQRWVTEKYVATHPLTQKQIDALIRKKLTQACGNINSIIRQNGTYKGEQLQTITAMLINEFGISNEAAITAAEKISERYNFVLDKASQIALKSAIKERKTGEKKSLNELFEQYANMGAFTGDYNEAVTAKLFDREGIKVNTALAEAYLAATTEEGKKEALYAIYKDLGSQMPSTFADKFNAWRYLAMLGNLRTHARNFFGNAVFAPVVLTKDLIATGIEQGLQAATKGKFEASKSLGVFKDGLWEAAMKDAKLMSDVISSGQKYEDLVSANEAIKEGRVIFDKKYLKWVEYLRKKNSELLETEDVIFSSNHYAFALAQYCSAKGITSEDVANGKIPDEARAYAIKEAQKATFRDLNWFSKKLSGLRVRGDNALSKAANIAIEGVLPFKKTPANILVRGVEYGPAGLAKSIYDMIVTVRKGEMSASEAIDEMSAGLTGTGLLLLGMLLASKGLVEGASDDDEKKAEFDELAGHQSYALVLGNKTFTIDWLAPAALPFFVGVEIAKLREREGVYTMAGITDIVLDVMGPMLELSCLQSLNDLIDSVRYAKENEAPMVALATAAIGYFTQIFPTLLGQTERIGENKRMQTFTNKDSWLTSDAQYLLGKISAKIPGVDYQQIPYIDAWGRVKETGGIVERALNNYINPSYVSEVKVSAMEQELQRLYEATKGENNISVYPKRAEKHFTVRRENPITGEKESEDYYLSADEYVQYATAKGTTAYKTITAFMEGPIYNTLDDKEKARAISNLYSYAEEYARTTVTDHEPEGLTKRAMAAAEQGIDFDTFFNAYVVQSSVEADKDFLGDTVTNSASSKKIDAIDKITADPDKRLILYKELDVGVTAQNNAILDDAIDAKINGNTAAYDAAIERYIINNKGADKKSATAEYEKRIAEIREDLAKLSYDDPAEYERQLEYYRSGSVKKHFSADKMNEAKKEWLDSYTDSLARKLKKHRGDTEKEKLIYAEAAKYGIKKKELKKRADKLK